VTPYDRLEITVFGELMYARPIDFVFDGDGNPISAIKWEAVNPNDGQLLQFTENNIVNTNGVLTYSVEYIQKPISDVVDEDPACPFRDPINFGLLVFEDKVSAEMPSKHEDVAPKQEAVTSEVVDCPFQDPVAIGLM